ncbi:SPOR domain-containing protein [Sphingomonas sp. SM33]|uniref:SPOR domain-containing protein n=1 Tax=Sphingomonas telluris TaxID=2907998 RepID=A0ABS9VJX5_9SPHN|nr:SPOR domain-containing protein [Sphingomonas telluris]MCH8615285.1 SPOR domain-containing protein [Sphingomonas telluris]
MFASLSWAAPLQAQSVKAGIDAWQQADYAKAVSIWRPLAEAGDADAAFNLGQAYRLGRGVPLNLGTAQTWLQRAAEKDHLDAQTTLGLLLFGNGNQAEGARWLKQAAEKGDARAMLIFGTALFNGDGVTQDQVLGYAYVSRAAAQGLEPAKSTLEQMNSVMSVEDRKKGVAIAMQKAKTQAKAAPKPSKVAQAAKPAAPKPAAIKPMERSPSVVATSGAWRIQLGAFSQRSSAEALFRKLAGSSPIAGHQMVLVPAGSITRLQVGPFESKAAASSACASLSAKGQACFPVSGR